MVVTGFLNFPLVYFICLDRVRSYSLICILCTCMAAVTFPASSSTLARLVRYSILRAYACFFAAFLPEYDDRSTVLISFLLTLDVTFGK